MQEKNDHPEPSVDSPRRELETWNPPEAIAEHRAMTPEQRLRKAIALSQAALRFAGARRIDER